MGKEMKDLQSEENEKLPYILDQIDQKVADWARADPQNVANKVKDLTDYVNRIANDHAVIGGVFSVLDPERSIVVLAKNYLENNHTNLSTDEEKLRLFPYPKPNGISEKFPRLIKVLGENKTEFSYFVDSLFTNQREWQRLNHPKGSLLPEFLKSDLCTLKEISNKKIIGYLTAWLYTLFCAANSDRGLQASNGTPDPNMSIGGALLAAIGKTPHYTQDTLNKTDIFNRYFGNLYNESTDNNDPILQLLLDCNLEDVVSKIENADVFYKNAVALLFVFEVDTTSSFIAQLEDIARKAPFPLIPYLCLIALYKEKKIAHISIPMHHTRSFKHHVVANNYKSEIRSCGVFFLGTVDETKVSKRTLAAITKAMAAPILDQMYYGGFQKILAKKVGEDEGVEKAIMAFGHQVKTLTGGISGEQKKWLFPLTALSKFCGSDDAVIETLLNGARDKGLTCEVTPVPQLLESLGRSMSFWSMSHSSSALDIPESFFDNFAQLVSKSAEFAHSLRLASEFARKDMSNAGNLARLMRFPKIKIVADDGNSNRQCENIAERNQIYVVLHGLISWRINREMFRKNGSSDFEMDSHNKIYWQELAGLIRLFAIIIEGAIEYQPQPDAYGKTPKAEIVFNVTQASNSGGRIRITARNSCRPMADRQQDPSRYLGMHGTQIREFLCERFLLTLAPKMPIDVIEEDTLFTIAFEINEPKWIRVGCSDE